MQAKSMEKYSDDGDIWSLMMIVRSLLFSIEHLRCIFMKSGSAIMEFHCFKTHKKRRRAFTGN